MTMRPAHDLVQGEGLEWAMMPYMTTFEKDPDFVAERLALDVTEEAIQLMEEKGITRAELAELMDVSRPYATRVLHAPPNLTLRCPVGAGIGCQTTDSTRPQ